MGYYLKIRFKEKFDGRKIWYFNNTYLCDCVNTTFSIKEEAEKWIPEIMKLQQYPYLQGKNIESITVHKKR
jgi:hypothetical protein